MWLNISAYFQSLLIVLHRFPRNAGIRDKRLVEAATQNPPFRYTTVRDGATEATLAKNYPEMNEYMNVSIDAAMLVQCLWADSRYTNVYK